MAITFKIVVGAAALVGATTLVTTQVVSQQHEKDMAEMQQEMMERWIELGKPGPEHKQMVKAAGQWQQQNTYWQYPGAEPEETASTATLKPIFDGRFMVEKMKGKTKMGDELIDIEGMGIFGYDNLTEKHQFVWLSSMGTGMMIGEGEADESGKTITYYSEMKDPMGGGMTKFKSVSQTLSDDHQIFRMYMKSDDGSWWKHMEIDATREKTASVR